MLSLTENKPLAEVGKASPSKTYTSFYLELASFAILDERDFSLSLYTGYFYLTTHYCRFDGTMLTTNLVFLVVLPLGKISYL